MLKITKMIKYLLLQFMNVADGVLRFDLQPNEWGVYKEN